MRAYITIALSEIRKEYAELDVPDAERYPHFPAVKIARLATDVGFEGQGMGSSLIEFVVGLVTKQIMPFVGCRFFILDANPEKIDFYKKRGFFLVDLEENINSRNPVMLMDLHKVGGSAGVKARCRRARRADRAAESDDRRRPLPAVASGKMKKTGPV